MSTWAVVRSFIESKTTEVQTSNVAFTSEVSDYLEVHTGPDVLHVICTLLRPGHLSGRVETVRGAVRRLSKISICVGDSSRCREEIVKNLYLCWRQFAVP